MTEILITSSVLIASLLIMRRLFKNILSRRIQYALWGLVLIRLLVPFSLPAVDFSVLSAAKPVEETISQHITALPVDPPAALAPRSNHFSAPAAFDQAETHAGDPVHAAQNEKAVVKHEHLSKAAALRSLRIAGSAALALWLLFINIGFWLHLIRVRKPFDVKDCPLPVYIVPKGLSSPCLFGLFRPAIYLTVDAAGSPERLRYVIAHEMTHARHCDPLWALLRGVCLVFYWFDPFVWAASYASKSDCEAACDEGTLSRFEDADRIPYGQTLLSLIPVRRTFKPMLAATSMSAGKRQLKERITRIAKKPQQLAAAAVAVILLAALVSACTFTGGTAYPKDERSLTGEELRYFNEMYFNSAGNSDEYRYNIRNQFANPLNLYEKPEDINIFELFYCDGTNELSDEEFLAAFNMDRYDLPCDASKITRDEIDRTLTEYIGLTLDKTNKTGLENFTYLPDYDAYYIARGDTNYPGSLSFITGTRAGNTIKLYQTSFFVDGWYVVTLEEESDGSYRFISNTSCEQPAVPTPMPEGEPVAAMPLGSLDAYKPSFAVSIEKRTDDFDDKYENRLDNWLFGEHNIVIYRSLDGEIYAAVREGDTMNVFFTGLDEGSSIYFFNDLFGHDGLTITHVDEPGADGRRDTLQDYFYLTDDGTPVLLAETRSRSGTPIIIDLDGDGINELVSDTEIYFQRGNDICHVVFEDMDIIPGGTQKCRWDIYSKSLSILTGDDTAGDVLYSLYFDGEQLLLFK